MCRSFLHQCSIVFKQQPQTYSTDRSKVAYVVELFMGKTKARGPAVWNSFPSITFSYEKSVVEMKVFDPLKGRDASKRLLSPTLPRGGANSGRACLSLAEYLWRINTVVSIYCGLAGYFLASCSLQPKEARKLH